MRVPLLDLKEQYGKIKDEISLAIEEVVNSQCFILGPKVEELEREIAKYCGVRFAVGVASGSDALIISLRAIGVGYGDMVITSPFTFFATAGAIYNVGARPVFVDINPDTFNLDPGKISQFLRSLKREDLRKVKAIIPVHLFGQIAEMDDILRIAQEFGLKVIEDAAQAIGAEYNSQRAGSIGDLGCFSFFPSKNLGGYGDGGMIVTNDEKLAEKVKMLHLHGVNKSKYEHLIVGYNSRLDALQASILKVKLKYLDEWSEKRRRNAAYYNELFKETSLSSNSEYEALNSSKYPVILPRVSKGRRHIFNQYTIRIRRNKRDELKKFLEKKGVGTAIYYPLPLHLQKCFCYLGHKEGDFPVAEKASKEVLSLPIYPELTNEMQEYVVQRIREYFRS